MFNGTDLVEIFHLDLKNRGHMPQMEKEKGSIKSDKVPSLLKKFSFTASPRKWGSEAMPVRFEMCFACFQNHIWPTSKRVCGTASTKLLLFIWASRHPFIASWFQNSPQDLHQDVWKVTNNHCSLDHCLENPLVQWIPAKRRIIPPHKNWSYVSS